MTAVEIKAIDVENLKKLWDYNPTLCVIDVREKHEWDDGHMPNAKHIPKDQIAEKIEEISPDKTSAIYLHCRSGTRSQIAASTLISQGYKNVYSVDGGIVDWDLCGFEVVK